MRHLRESSSEETVSSQKTRIDGHPLLAKQCAILGIVPAGAYWFAFTAFGSSSLPWQIACAIEILCPIFVYTHYLLNRRPRRLFWEGITVCVSCLPAWMLAGSYWFFYLSFAPVPPGIRLAALPICLAVTGWWIWLPWRNYQRATQRLGLVEQMQIIEPDLIVYPDALDRDVSMLEGSGLRMSVPYWLVSTLGPIFIAYAMLSGRVFDTTRGPHGVFIIMSILSLPMSCWLVGHIFVRTAYFHIYLPLKLERETGKRVILGS